MMAYIIGVVTITDRMLKAMAAYFDAWWASSASK